MVPHFDSNEESDKPERVVVLVIEEPLFMRPGFVSNEESAKQERVVVEYGLIG